MFEIFEDNGVLDIRITSKVLKLLRYQGLNLNYEKEYVYNELRDNIKFNVDSYCTQYPNSRCVKQILACVDYVRKHPRDHSSDKFCDLMDQYYAGFDGIFSHNALNIMQMVDVDGRCIKDDVFMYLVLNT